MNAEPVSRLPEHVAVIMDGNNRWARARGLNGVAGHRAGAERVRDLVDSCLARGIPYLTLFAFSSENWLRPPTEVRGLMALFLRVLKRKEIEQFHQRNVRIRFIGNRHAFSKPLQEHMQQVEMRTGNNDGLTVTVAADYGGRWDIVQAARRVVEDIAGGRLAAASLDVPAFQQYLCLADLPEPDLCIRTGGEHRISNFLLWQLAYTELFFTDCFWPDFDDASLQLALDDFARRQRRFGRHGEVELTE
jgi:undecaprenyl diphosphate synthase